MDIATRIDNGAPCTYKQARPGGLHARAAGEDTHPCAPPLLLLRTLCCAQWAGSNPNDGRQVYVEKIVIAADDDLPLWGGGELSWWAS